MAADEDRAHPHETAPVEEAVPVLRVTDAERAAAWYARLGFAVTWEHRFAPGMPVFLELRRGAVTLFLSEHVNDAPPDGLIYLRVRDVDAAAAEFGAAVTAEAWARETELHDPDGNRVRVGTPLP
ncbi:glyoxalase superfamily protein [Streptomyces spiramenti]|uniref:VOC family protein n=1 Tax=Streptomyces spiramenti TaxID=2720606 RepID=A0ABX1AIF9_9ACTN|nr:glyoxalase superfamily protein [Streptomyces spiramenti]NJP66937.1 VOC family protein [Streptomyces spiramenti]